MPENALVNVPLPNANVRNVSGSVWRLPMATIQIINGSSGRLIGMPLVVMLRYMLYTKRTTLAHGKIGITRMNGLKVLVSKIYMYAILECNWIFSERPAKAASRHFVPIDMGVVRLCDNLFTPQSGDAHQSASKCCNL